MISRLVEHFLSHEESITYLGDGEWSHKKTKFVTYLSYVDSWATKKFGETNRTFFKHIESALMTLGAGSNVFWVPVSVPTSRGSSKAVQMTVKDPNGSVRYRNIVYYDYEDPDWFTIAVNVGCSTITDSSPRKAFQ